MPKEEPITTLEQETRIFTALQQRNSDEIDELLGAYTSAIGMPQDTVEDQDNRRAELSAIDELAEEFADTLGESDLGLSTDDQQSFEGFALTSILRQKAAQSILETQEDVTERQAATDHIPEVEPLALRSAEKRQMPNMLKQAQVVRTLSRMGIEIDTKGGKGSHIKVRNPDTGQVTVIPQKLESGTTKKHLRQIGIDPQDFLDNF